MSEDMESPPDVWEMIIRGKSIAQPRPIIVRMGKTYSLATPTTMGKGTQAGVREHPIHAWKRAASRACRQLLPEGLWIVGPVRVDCEFIFPRPGYMITKRDPMPRVHHTAKPDRDNLDKAILDSMSGLLFRDDAQVAAGWIEKWVAAGDEEPRALISVSLLPGANLEPQPDPPATPF